MDRSCTPPRWDGRHPVNDGAADASHRPRQRAARTPSASTASSVVLLTGSSTASVRSAEGSEATARKEGTPLAPPPPRLTPKLLETLCRGAIHDHASPVYNNSIDDNGDEQKVKRESTAAHRSSRCFPHILQWLHDTDTQTYSSRIEKGPQEDLMASPQLCSPGSLSAQRGSHRCNGMNAPPGLQRDSAGANTPVRQRGPVLSDTVEVSPAPRPYLAAAHDIRHPPSSSPSLVSHSPKTHPQRHLRCSRQAFPGAALFAHTAPVHRRPDLHPRAATSSSAALRPPSVSLARPSPLSSFLTPPAPLSTSTPPFRAVIGTHHHMQPPSRELLWTSSTGEGQSGDVGEGRFLLSTTPPPPTAVSMTTPAADHEDKDCRTRSISLRICSLSGLTLRVVVDRRQPVSLLADRVAQYLHVHHAHVQLKYVKTGLVFDASTTAAVAPHDTVSLRLCDLPHLTEGDVFLVVLQPRAVTTATVANVHNAARGSSLPARRGQQQQPPITTSTGVAKRRPRSRSPSHTHSSPEEVPAATAVGMRRSSVSQPSLSPPLRSRRRVSTPRPHHRHGDDADGCDAVLPSRVPAARSSTSAGRRLGGSDGDDGGGVEPPSPVSGELGGGLCSQWKGSGRSEVRVRHGVPHPTSSP
jgi:hypothetical protein